MLNARTISEQEKPWEQYSPAEKRIAIAYDVLQAVLADVYEPTRMLYINLGSLREKAMRISNFKLRDELRAQSIKDLQVDAIGAAFLSLVRFENHFDPLMDACDLVPIEPIGIARGRIQDLFGKDQLGLIESAFERLPLYEFADTTEAEDFGADHEDDTERMCAIWLNIINNDGTFNPITRKQIGEQSNAG